MQTKSIQVQCDVYCKWDGNDTRYRVYVNDELFTERTWIWNGSIWISVAAGFTGSIGFTGSAGFTGSQGNIGFTGSASTVAGPIGFTGSQGVTGFTGSSASGVPDFINMMQGTI